MAGKCPCRPFLNFQDPSLVNDFRTQIRKLDP